MTKTPSNQTGRGGTLSVCQRTGHFLFILSLLISAVAQGQTLRIVTNPSDLNSTTLYPQGSSGTPEDWNWKNLVVTAYIVPDPGNQLFAAKCEFNWDAAAFTAVGVDRGNMWQEGFFYAAQTGSSYRIDAATHGTTNYTVGVGDYVARIRMKLNRPGISSLTMSNIDVRDVNNQPLNFSSAPAVTHFFLGDCAAYSFPIIDQSRGDGVIDFGDLTGFGSAYFSSVADAVYKTKYDIGPTSDGNVESLPTVDDAVGFPDLVMFSLMYGRTSVPKQSAGRHDPLVVFKQDQVRATDERTVEAMLTTQISLFLPSTLHDVRAMEFTVRGEFKGSELISIIPSASLSNYGGQIILAAHVRQHEMIVDIGLMNGSMDIGSDLAVITLKGLRQNAAGVPELKQARNSHNINLVANTLQSPNVPSKLTVHPAYPNPFNPSTTIQYSVPDAGTTVIRIVSVSGQEVFKTTRMDESGGEHQFVWNGCNNEGSNLPTGIYFVRFEAGTSMAAIKTLLVR